MAQMERILRTTGSSGNGSTSRNTITTMEQFLNYNDTHFHEEDHSQHSRKSVLTKMKEKTKRWRETLVKKKPDDNVTPSWGVSLEEEDDYDHDVEPEYLGAPMYESELAPEDCKEAARQHPRANPVISDKHFLATNFTTQHHEEEDKDWKGKQIDLSADDKTITQTMADKLSPACSAVTATLTPIQANSPIFSPNTSNTRTGSVANMRTGTSSSAPNTRTGNVVNMGTGVGVVAGISPRAANACTGSIASMDTGISPRAANTRTGSVARMDTGICISPRAANTRTGSVASMGAGTSTGISPSAANTLTGSVSSMGTSTGTGISPRAANTLTGSIASMGTGVGAGDGAGAGYHQQQWDKGVPVKEYLTHKLEPGEDEIALSQVTTEAINPRKPTASGGDKHEEGMVEKVKDAVSSLLWSSNDSSPSSSASKATKSTTIKTKPANNATTNVPVSTNAYSAVQEEEEQINKGRILQTN